MEKWKCCVHAIKCVPADPTIEDIQYALLCIWDSYYCFTTAGSDKVEVRDHNEEADTLQFKDQNMQTEIVQIKAQQVQAESTTQQQGIKTAAIAVWLCTILSVVSNTFVWSSQ